ncbi:SipW-dependent-type signal peptide-containing protein [Microbacterium sp. SL75]|uniref:SipW-dependent-type signal peptide-containing protein n=1 Tax=Microbacterium sp. SL75 TaxID=2995140 RepID=UPI00227158D8|nr:SipW-dependent-type signal peptide-containing protein [Microbacterium sp. SL75]WAC69354.1 SipW-dependent-type signal peptide-containing protein [Microbacterium sp. SL75]
MNLKPSTWNKKKTLIASMVLLSVGLGGTVATGAYFTDTKQIAANSITAGTVILGNPSDGGTAAAPQAVTFANVLPIADADVATKAQTFNLNVRNNGTAAINWKAFINRTSPSTAQENALAKQLMLQYSTDGGFSWSTPGALDNQAGKAISSSSVLASNATQVIKFRAWLPATTDNTFQGLSLPFELMISAIQAGGV